MQVTNCGIQLVIAITRARHMCSQLFWTSTKNEWDAHLSREKALVQERFELRSQLPALRNLRNNSTILVRHKCSIFFPKNLPGITGMIM